jgi:putative ABC transport system ATP-binding protein
MQTLDNDSPTLPLARLHVDVYDMESHRISDTLDVGQHSAAAAVRLENVTKIFGEGPLSVCAVRAVSLEIQRGDFVAIVGPSGSGKSTLLDMIAGLDRPTSGAVYIDGAKLATLSDRALSAWRARNVGLMFQSHNLIPVLDSYQNVALPLMLGKLDRRVRDERILAALDLVGLSARTHHYPGQLSQGESQRVAIARSIVHDPVIIILDEPTGNLDRENAEQVLSLLRRLNRDSERTIIMVTHDLKATEYANRIIQLDKGVLR